MPGGVGLNRLGTGEETARALLDACTALALLLGLDGTIVALNEAAANSLGHPREDLSGICVFDLLPPESAEVRKERMAEAIRSRKPVRFVDYRDGRWFDQAVCPVTGSDGAITQVAVHATDITAHRRTEEALRDADRELTRVLDAMGEGLIAVDAEGRVTRLNRKACELLETSEDRAIGRDVASWCHSSYRREFERTLGTRREGGGVPHEGQFVAESDATFDAVLTITPILDEKSVYGGAVICLCDVTEARRMAEEIRGLHDLHDQLLRVVDVWINITATDGRILLWNRKAEEISGYVKEEVLGERRIWEWLYPDAEYCAAIWRRQQQMRMEDSACRSAETTIRTKSGEKRVLQWDGRPLTGPKGTLTGWLVVAHDVTEQQRDERRLRDYAREVERLNREKTRVLSMASHELRTPLTAIQGFADLLARDPGLGDVPHERVGRIRAHAERLSLLLGDLLSISRIESGTGELASETVDAGDVLRECVDSVMACADAEGVTILVEETGGASPIRAERHALEQIVFNILGNAISYTPAPGRITARAWRTESGVDVEIADTGIGLSAQELARIFDEFYRTSDATRLKPDGTGLGLSIVKRLVESIGGTMGVQSEGKGEGTRFSLSFPAADAGGTQGPGA